MTLISNHELWHTCLNCGERFDRRQTTDICPKCGTVASTNKKSRFSIIVFLALLVITTSCSIQKNAKQPAWRRVEYRNPDRSLTTQVERLRRKVRKFENRLLQEVIQWQSSMNAWEDHGRIDRNRDRAPKSNWPFQFLQ